MPKQVEGFLASDNTFFEHEPECDRYERLRELERLCVAHSINFENFTAILNAWHKSIEGYYNADIKCKAPQVGKQTLDLDGDADRAEPLLPTEEDRTYHPSGDKDAPGFLEQQIRGNF
jgi:hypothetical protein